MLKAPDHHVCGQDLGPRDAGREPGGSPFPSALGPSTPSCKWGGGGAPSRVLGQGQGCSTHPDRLPRCPQDLSPSPGGTEAPGLHCVDPPDRLVKMASWNEAFQAGPGLAQPRRGPETPGLQPQRPRQPCVPGAAASPPEPWPLSDGHNRDRTHGRGGREEGQPGWAGWLTRVRPPLGPQEDRDPRQLSFRHR